MDRVLINTSAPIQTTFAVDGVPTDATGSVLVTVTRGDGTVVTNAATATKPPTTIGIYTFTLTPTPHTGLLDTLNAAWTATIGGVVQTVTTTVEVVGGFVFSLAQGLKAMSGSTAADVAAARTYAETELESALGFALVPRFALETKSVPGHDSSYGCSTRRDPALRLRPFVRSIRSVTIAGTALTAPELAALTFDAGFVRGYSWPTGYSNIIVGYEHGLATPPPGATRAALALAIDYLGGTTNSGIDPRAESIITVDGTVRLRAAAGQFSAVGVNEWIAANRIPSIA